MGDFDLVSVLRGEWCPREDSNLHDLAATRSSGHARIVQCRWRAGSSRAARMLIACAIYDLRLRIVP